MPRFSRALLASAPTLGVLLALTSITPGCSGEDGAPGKNAGGTSGSGGAAGASGGAAGSAGAAGSGGSAGMGGSAGASGAAGAGGTPATCAELGAQTCFSNYDCPSTSDRCENIGSESTPDVCCVPGVRGTKIAGEACSMDIDCKSAICIDSLCSDTCKTADNCPSTMKVCKPIAFSGSTDFWCFPNP